MSDELRDRIAGLICDQTGCHPIDADLATQRIIIDLGLATETVADHARVLMGMSDTHMRRRVVGKWERA